MHAFKMRKIDKKYWDVEIAKSSVCETNVIFSKKESSQISVTIIILSPDTKFTSSFKHRSGVASVSINHLNGVILYQSNEVGKTFRL